MWDKLDFVEGEKGSEDGIIIFDEEYKGACRITLEKMPKVLCYYLRSVWSDGAYCFL